MQLADNNSHGKAGEAVLPPSARELRLQREADARVADVLRKQAIVISRHGNDPRDRLAALGHEIRLTDELKQLEGLLKRKSRRPAR